MTKSSGIPAQIEVDNSAGVAKDISNDVNNFTLKTSKGEFDMTGLDKAALERLLLLADAELSLTGMFNPDLSHRVFRDVGVGNPRETTVTYPGGCALDHIVLNLVFSSYVVARGADGALTWTSTGKLADGTVPTFV